MNLERNSSHTVNVIKGIRCNVAPKQNKTTSLRNINLQNSLD